MTEEHQKLTGLLLKHEGLELKPYLCSSGKVSIGVGRNLEDNGITKCEALFLLENDIDRCFEEALREYPWFRTLDPVRKDVVASMIFNMGLGRFNEFKNMIFAVHKGDWQLAANEMLNSRWSAQVKKRAVELAEMMRTGLYREDQPIG